MGVGTLGTGTTGQELWGRNNGAGTTEAGTTGTGTMGADLWQKGPVNGPCSSPSQLVLGQGEGLGFGFLKYPGAAESGAGLCLYPAAAASSITD